jgi:SAM-dependent methyltransferase
MGLWTRAALLLAPRRTVRAAFRRHFVRRDWLEPETVSGRGSALPRTAAIRRDLPPLLAELGVRTLLDAGCGDFHWFRTLELESELQRYVGVEVVDELTAANRERFGTPQREFVTADVIGDPLPAVDLILCRDCLVHLKNRQIVRALRNFRRSGSRWLLATTFTGDHPNDDAPLGGWRPVNLARPPFALGPPLRLLPEAESVEDGAYRDKSLGLWRLARA